MVDWQRDRCGRGRRPGRHSGLQRPDHYASYADVSVTGVYDAVALVGGEKVGGLVGDLFGGSVAASYAAGSVEGDYDIGGLAGRNSRGTITASYATGSVDGDEAVGGLVGNGTSGPP